MQIIQCFIKTKHIDTQFFFVREKVQSKKIHIEYCNIGDNDVDIFTKPLGRIKFELFREMLGVLVNPYHIEYCNTRDNAANIFTKPLGRIKFELFREMLGLLVNPFCINGEC